MLSCPFAKSEKFMPKNFRARTWALGVTEFPKKSRHIQAYECLLIQIGIYKIKDRSSPN